MNCYYHPEREIVGKCKNCGRLICDECKVDLGEKIYCILCADAPGRRTAVPENLSWFERHLNWSVVLGWLAGCLAFFVVLMIGFSDPYISHGHMMENVYTTGAVIYLGIVAGVWVWALRKKKQSLGWLPLGLFVPFGWVVFVLLENRSAT